jgi:hypothetical protein
MFASGAAIVPAGGEANVQSECMSNRHKFPLQQWRIPVIKKGKFPTKMGIVQLQSPLERLLHWTVLAPKV